MTQNHTNPLSLNTILYPENTQYRPCLTTGDQQSSEEPWVIVDVVAEEPFYRPLGEKEIRLLEVLPESDGPELQFAVRHFEHTSAPLYVALSYVWGCQAATEEVLLDDRPFCVNPDLWCCLRHWVRHVRRALADAENGIINEFLFLELSTDRPVYIWIDAICINQVDEEEREQQVRRMGFIYFIASSIVIWLGQEEESEVPGTTCGIGEWEWSKKIPQLANRPHWTRMWVVQEFSNARHKIMLYGQRWIELEDFLELYSAWATSGEGRVQHQCCPAAPLMTGYQDFNTDSLVDMFIKYRHNASADPKDKFFALLGMLPQQQRVAPERFFPNYKLTYQETAVIAAAHAFKFDLFLGQEERCKLLILLSSICPEASELALQTADAFNRLDTGELHSKWDIPLPKVAWDSAESLLHTARLRAAGNDRLRGAWKACKVCKIRLPIPGISDDGRRCSHCLDTGGCFGGYLSRIRA